MTSDKCPHCGEPLDHDVELGEEVEFLPRPLKEVHDTFYQAGLADGRREMTNSLYPYLKHTSECVHPFRACNCGRDALLEVMGLPK